MKLKYYIASAFALPFLLSLPSYGQVIAQYTGGEGDPGVALNIEIPKTAGQVKDVSGSGFNLTASSGAGPYYVAGAGSGSTYAYGFDPSTSNFLSANAPVTSLTTNFSIQATVTANSSNASGTHFIVNNGIDSNGFGILVYDGLVYGIINGVTLVGSGSAIVFDDATAYTFKLENIGGMNTFYANGVQVGSSVFAEANQATTHFTVGASISTTIGSQHFFGGRIDNIVVAAVPEPSAMALLGLALGVALVVRLRFAKTAAPGSRP